jgi:hypothetical protein
MRPAGLIDRALPSALRGDDRESTFFGQENMREMQDRQKARRAARDLRKSEA